MCRALILLLLLALCVPSWYTVNAWGWNFWRFRRHDIVTISSSKTAGISTSDATSEIAGDLDIENKVDSYFMKRALAEAKKAGKRGEVPIGAIVVRPLIDDSNPKNDDEIKRRSFEVLSVASNEMEQRRDASAHAELQALRKAALNNGSASWRLLNTTLYVTVEPCPMCLSAAQAFRVNRIVYGAPDMRLGAIDTYLNLLDVKHPIHNINKVTRGVHQEESAALLRDFFRSRRAK